MDYIPTVIEGLKDPDICVELEDIPEEIRQLLSYEKGAGIGGFFKFGGDRGYGLVSPTKLYVVITVGGKLIVTMCALFHRDGQLLSCKVEGAPMYQRLSQSERRALMKCKGDIWNLLTEAMV